jgi:hypothetical protein
MQGLQYLRTPLIQTIRVLLTLFLVLPIIVIFGGQGIDEVDIRIFGYSLILKASIARAKIFVSRGSKQSQQHSIRKSTKTTQRVTKTM